eukprot:g39808.t1
MSRPVILTGDFNCIIDTDGRSGGADSELDSMSRFLMETVKVTKLHHVFSIPADGPRMGFDVTEDLQEVKSQQALLFPSEAPKIIFRPRVRTVEQVETHSRFFSQKESSVLSSLKEEDGSVTSPQSDILTISKSFYARLYDMKPTHSAASQSDTIAYVQDRGVDACLIGLDQEKAFDRILYTYMWDVLSKMGFGEGICNWIRLVYPSIVKPFAESIRKDVSLRGVTIPGSGGLQVKASLYVDDFAVFCSDLLSVRKLMSICDQFELASGAKVNGDKHKAVLFENWAERSFIPFAVRTDYPKMLGIWFRGAGMCTKSWEETIAKSIRKWSVRSILETLREMERVDLWHGSLSRLS